MHAQSKHGKRQMLHVILFANEATSSGRERKDSYCFASPALVTAVEVWASCRRTLSTETIWMASPSVKCVGFALCNRGCFQNSSSNTIRLFIVLFGKFWCRCFALSSERDKNFYAPALAFFARAYLAVKADDLCTVFTLEFMCYCDKAGGVVCVSVWWFMSVYWDCRLSDGLLEDTNNLPWECKVPWVPNPSPYLQRSHMSNACCPLHHLTTALLVTICKLHAFSCVLQGGYNELHLGKTIASDCQKRLKYINKKLLSLC